MLMRILATQIRCAKAPVANRSCGLSFWVVCFTKHSASDLCVSTVILFTKSARLTIPT